MAVDVGAIGGGATSRIWPQADPPPPEGRGGYMLEGGYMFGTPPLYPAAANGMPLRLGGLGLGFGVGDLGFRVWGRDLGVTDLGFRI